MEAEADVTGADAAGLGAGRAADFGAGEDLERAGELLVASRLFAAEKSKEQ